MESHLNIIRDLTESLLTQYVTDVDGVEHITQTQLSNAIRAAVRSFKFSLSVQLKTSTNANLTSLNLAEADGPPNSADHDPHYLGTSQQVDHKAILFPTCFERLAVFKDQSLSIDAVIKSGPLRIGAHSIILAAAIPFFQGLFVSANPPQPTLATNNHEIELNIDGVDPIVVISIIEWAYTGQIVLTNATVQSLLIAAGYLGCESIIDAASDFIRQRISIENVLEVILVAESLSCTALAKAAREYVDRYFYDIIDTEHWKQGPAQLITSILGSGDLYVESETTVWSAFKAWLSGNPSSNAEQVHQMMSNIRIHLLSPQFIRDQVLSFEPVAANLLCRNLIDDAILAHCNVDFDRAKIDPDDDCIVRHHSHHQSTMSKYSPRFCSHLHNQVYLIGGFASAAVHESIDTVDMFDPRTKTWKQVPQMRRCRGRLGVAVLNGRLYVLGGFDSSVRLKSAECFDPITNSWSSIASMGYARSAPACTAMDGRLYVCGGYNGESCLSSCESYDPKTNTWSPLPNMARARSAAAATCFAGRLYVTGGCDVVQFFNCVEVFDGKQWGEMTPMISKRCRHGSIVFQGQLWAVGGYNGRFLATVEQYNFSSDQWVPMTATMNVRRGRVGVVTSGSKVYAIGGYDGMHNLTTMETFDPEEGQWIMAGKMARHEGGVGVAALPINCSNWLAE